ncbi:MAG: hypothetical protein HPY57_15650 [Ignavibacteria bacterium]|nr:hypothetical protein [Ignavibacteria bacterium]
MKTEFDKFLNEYGGPGKAIGFRYSEPSINYTFSINVVVNPELKPVFVKNIIKDIFKKHNVGEDSISFRHVGADEYKLTIKIKGYSKYEIISMIDLLMKNVNKKLRDDVLFIFDSIDLQGRDIEVKNRPIGFKPNQYED